MERMQKLMCSNGVLFFSIPVSFSVSFFFSIFSSSSSSSSLLFVVMMGMFLADDSSFIYCAAQRDTALEVGFYGGSCPEAESIVRTVVTSHFQSDITLPAALLRLHFHDCFVRGCDGSILIDGSNVERTAPANSGLRGFQVIEEAKSMLEDECPGIVSCADILALAARDAVDFSGGPSWLVPLGRRDGTMSLASDASNMPSPLDSIPTLMQKFAKKGLSTQDLVVLSGGHTLGQVECRFFAYRLYNYSGTGRPDPAMDSGLRETLRAHCPQGGDGSKKVALDTGSQTQFDASFFANLLRGYGVLESDQKLMSDTATSFHVQSYADPLSGLPGFRFHADFSASIIKMSSIDVLTGSHGQIRRACSSFN